MVRARLDEDRVALLHGNFLAFDGEHTGALEHDVDLVVVVRLLAVGLRRGEHIHAELEPGRVVHDLIPAAGGAQLLDHVLDLEGVHAVEPTRRASGARRPTR